MRKILILFLAFAVVAVLVGVTLHLAAANEGFIDDFSEPTLDPSWQVVPGLGSYSLTDSPGYLRYHLEGPRAYAGGWRTGYPTGSWNPSETLIRPFEGENWTLKTKVTYNTHACNNVNRPRSGSTGGQFQYLWIALGEGTNDYLYVTRGTDWWYGSNVRLNAGLYSNGVLIASDNTLPAIDDVVKQEEGGGWARYTYWYEVVRNGQEITFRYSYDGTNYVTVFSASLTTPVEATQRVIIDATVYLTAGSHTDWDYIYVEPAIIPVVIDIKPGSCPNPLNLKSKGVLLVAILGTENFDVTTIDPETILLTREDYEDPGVAPLRWSYEDVATPFEGELCECHDLDGDGYLDLTLKFKTQELVKTLWLDHEEVAGETIPLILTGNLKEEEGGTQITGSDCVRVLKTGKK